MRFWKLVLKTFKHKNTKSIEKTGNMSYFLHGNKLLPTRTGVVCFFIGLHKTLCSQDIVLRWLAE